MGCPFSPAGAVRDPSAQPESPVAPPAPGTSPGVFLEETRTRGITSPQTLQALSGCPEKLLHHMGSLGQIIVPCLAEGEILRQNVCVIIFPGPEAGRQRSSQEDVCEPPALPTGHPIPRTGTGAHRQGQGGDATRAPSRCCRERRMSPRLFMKAAHCCVSPAAPSPAPTPPLAPRIPPQARRSSALRTPLLNPHPASLPGIPRSSHRSRPASTGQPRCDFAGTAASPVPRIRCLQQPPLPGEFVLGAEVLFLEGIFLMGISDVTQARGSNSPVPWYLHLGAQAGEGLAQGAGQAGREGALCFVWPGPHHSLKGEEPIPALPSPACPGCNYAPRQAQQALGKKKKIDLKSFTNDHWLALRGAGILGHHLLAVFCQHRS